ncbi:matrix metalloproteinase-11 [Rhodobacteraceae bacterium 2CG4]|uniref:Matrix metalloproteinase-11 n=1 Tax=Halovulum marinum TaxID=2662447 RepID=A0A6L5Z5R8_9RHOB|nr:matrix metalloproteinase-11 [Halovulum marinum]
MQAHEEPLLHIYHNGAVCETETRGYAEPGNRSPLELAVDATDGFIPLWGPGATLRWRFRPTSLALFRDPAAAAAVLRTWFAEGLLLWGDAVPVRFQEVQDPWDFELAVSPQANCSPSGCSLARAFFPDAGQHDIVLYPTLFQQTRAEVIETLAHELGHVFGLRHFFAQITEARWRSEIFGDHTPFSIMNYGPDSRMTDTDRADLRTLYHLVWSGQLTEINGTPVRQMRPYSETGRCDPVPALVAAARPLPTTG